MAGASQGLVDFKISLAKLRGTNFRISQSLASQVLIDATRLDPFVVARTDIAWRDVNSMGGTTPYSLAVTSASRAMR